MKRLIALLLVALLSLGTLVGCGQKAVTSSDKNTNSKKENKESTKQEKKDKKIIGVSIVDFSDLFFVYMMDGMKEEAEKYDDVELVMVDGKSDMNAQTAQLENFIAQKVDAIVMVPIEKEAAVPIVETIHDSKIPLISVNRQLANQELAVSYAGSNAIESGEIEMKAMAEALGGKGNIVILEGAYGAEAALERRKGFDNILKEYPDIKIVAENTANWKRDEAMALMENWLQSDLGGIDGIVAANDEMAIGALMAVEDAGMLDKIKISGIDATPEALDYLEEGKLAITVFQDAKGQGAKAVELAIKAAHGEKIESEAMIPYELVSKDKVDEYRKKYE